MTVIAEHILLHSEHSDEFLHSFYFSQLLTDIQSCQLYF